MADLSSILGGLKARPIDIKAEADKWLSKGFDPANQYAQYGMSPPLRQGDMASIGLDMAPGVGDIKSGIEGLQAMTKGDSLGAVLGGLGALPAVPGFAGAIKTYHGSPHLFDKFDMSKIGTGEGAQAYGHGLYFAESPDVATQYRDALSAGELRLKGGGEYDPTNINHFAAAELLNYGGDRLKAISDIQKSIKQLAKIKSSWRDSAIDQKKSLINALMKGDLPELEEISHGNLYQTSLEWPDPAREATDPMGPQHFLDWNGPLIEQGDFVKSKLGVQDTSAARQAQKAFKSEMLAKYGGKLQDMLPNERETYLSLVSAMTEKPTIPGAWSTRDGDQFYRGSQFANNEDASQQLRALGIPGIRYLDQGSRGGGDGTYNYVVFDDQIPRIVSRNGEPIK